MSVQPHEGPVNARLGTQRFKPVSAPARLLKIGHLLFRKMGSIFPQNFSIRTRPLRTSNQNVSNAPFAGSAIVFFAINSIVCRPSDSRIQQPMTSHHRTFGTLVLLPILALLAAPSFALSQVSGRDSAEIAVEAVRYLKASEKAISWSAGFHRAVASEVIASGKPLSGADTLRGAVARIQGRPENSDAFTLASAQWQCVRPDKFLAAYCGLATTRYYVHVSELVIRGDSIFVPATVFVKDEHAPNGMRWLNTLVQVVRVGNQWKGERVLLVEM